MKADAENRTRNIAAWAVQRTMHSGLAVNDEIVRLTATWSSRTATLHHFTWSNSVLPDLVVKVHLARSEATAQYQSMCELASALEGLAQDVEVLTPIAFSEDIGAVLMPYVQGKILSDLLKYGDWTSTVFRDELHRFMNISGAMLARYHLGRKQRAECSQQEAWSKLKSRVVGFLGPDPRVEELALGSLVTQSYRDYHPGHIIVTETDKLVLLDPPVRVKCDFVYRDLAQFVYHLFIILIHPNGLARSPLRVRHRRSLVRQFLNGYGNGIGHPLTDDDQFFINAYEAYFLERLLHRSLRNVRSYPLLALRLVPTMYRIRDLRRTMRLHLKSS